LHDTLSADCKVLTVKSFLILNDDKVVGTVVRWENRLAVAIKELNGHVGSMLSEEGDGLVTGLDGLNHLPTGGVLADEVGLAEFCDLVVGGTFSVDNLLEVVVVEGFGVAGGGRLFLFFVVVLFLCELGHAAGHWVAVHIILHLFHLALETARLGAA
jgi:hypothetical protein